jgi:hypothetical protein
MCWTVYGLHGVFTDFYAYSVTTSSDLTHEKKIEFPAVTVCNMNRLNCLNLFYQQQIASDNNTDVNAAGRDEIHQFD